MGFGTLLVIVLAGIGGPLLGLSRRHFVPLMIGEVLAGVLVGDTGLRAIEPSGATLTFLGQVGFAMLMLTAGILTMIEGFSLVVWGSQPYAMPPFSGERPLAFGAILIPTQAFWVFGATEMGYPYGGPAAPFRNCASYSKWRRRGSS